MHSKLVPVTVEDPREQEFLAERSKIKAALDAGLSRSYLNVENLLYIGAAHGYTISHINHHPQNIYAVEKSDVTMRHFLPLALQLKNVMPILADGASPDSFAHHLPKQVDVIFQDIAQRDQTGIFLANCERFLSKQGVGLLSLKAAAHDSRADPEEVYAKARVDMARRGATIVQEIDLEPHQKGHRMFVIHLIGNYEDLW